MGGDACGYSRHQRKKVRSGHPGTVRVIYRCFLSDLAGFTTVTREGLNEPI